MKRQECIEYLKNKLKELRAIVSIETVEAWEMTIEQLEGMSDEQYLAEQKHEAGQLN